MPPIIPDLALSIWLLLVSVAAGLQILRLFGGKIECPMRRIVLALGLGFGALQFLPFFMFAVGIGNTWAARGLPALLTLILAPRIVEAAKLCAASGRALARQTPLLPVLPAYVLLLACSFLRAICPPLPSDATTYHIVATLRPLAAGHFVYLPTLTYTNWPSGAEMINALLLGIYHSAPTGLAQFVSGLLVCGALYLLGLQIGGPLVGAVSLVLLVFVRDFWGEIPTARVDVALTAFTVLSIFCLQCLYSEKESRDRVPWGELAAAFAGLAATIKLTGMWSIFTAGLLYCLILVRLRRKGVPALAARFVAIALVAVTPWFIKSIVLTGNPVYPMLYRIFGGYEWSAGGWERFRLGHLIFNTPPGYPATPGVLNTTHEIIAALGCAIAAVIVLLAWKRRTFVLWIGFAVFFACIASCNYLNGRFVLPVIPVLLAGIALPAARLRDGIATRIVTAVVALVFAVPLILKQPIQCVADTREAVRFALGGISERQFQHEHVKDCDLLDYANSHLLASAGVLVDHGPPIAFFHQIAMQSAYDLQDSVHYDTMDRLIGDLRRLHVSYLVLGTYPQDCDRNWACKYERAAARPLLDELSRTRGTPVCSAAGSILYCLNLDLRQGSFRAVRQPECGTLSGTSRLDVRSDQLHDSGHRQLR
jgi:hypothetical protein